MYQTRFMCINFHLSLFSWKQRHNFINKFSIADFCVYDRLDTMDNDTSSQLVHQWACYHSNRTRPVTEENQMDDIRVMDHCGRGRYNISKRNTVNFALKQVVVKAITSTSASSDGLFCCLCHLICHI